MLLIGSQALFYHFPNFRKPKDYDIITTSPELKEFLNNNSYKELSSSSKKKRYKIILNNKPNSFEFELIEDYPSSNIIY